MISKLKYLRMPDSSSFYLFFVIIILQNKTDHDSPLLQQQLPHPLSNSLRLKDSLYNALAESWCSVPALLHSDLIPSDLLIPNLLCLSSRQSQHKTFVVPSAWYVLSPDLLSLTPIHSASLWPGWLLTMEMGFSYPLSALIEVPVWFFLCWAPPSTKQIVQQVQGKPIWNWHPFISALTFLRDFQQILWVRLLYQWELPLLFYFKLYHHNYPDLPLFLSYTTYHLLT